MRIFTHLHYITFLLFYAYLWIGIVHATTKCSLESPHPKLHNFNWHSQALLETNVLEAPNFHFSTFHFPVFPGREEAKGASGYLVSPRLCHEAFQCRGFCEHQRCGQTTRTEAPNVEVSTLFCSDEKPVPKYCERWDKRPTSTGWQDFFYQ